MAMVRLDRAVLGGKKVKIPLTRWRVRWMLRVPASTLISDQRRPKVSDWRRPLARATVNRASNPSPRTACRTRRAAPNVRGCNLPWEARGEDPPEPPHSSQRGYVA